ncbi:MAG: hypothetical protein WC919_07720 [Candidatus Paceibacterota bacterium]|jgi:hypothetical protein
MASIILEFDIAGKKISRFNIRNRPDDIFWMCAGDEIGFDLAETNEYFYVTVSRKVYLVGTNKPLYVVCVPINFQSMDKLAATLEQFQKQFGDDMAIDAKVA